MGATAMTEGDKYEIAVLAEDEAKARQVYEAAGMRNSYGLPPAEVAERQIEYMRDQARWWDARLALTKAQARIATQP
jgi:hypothetical protein